MRQFAMAKTFSAIACLILVPTVAVSGNDSWTEFRGANGNGIATDQKVPSEFSESRGITWKTKLPGRGWSSPVVSDGVIWMTTAIENVPTEEERIAMLRDGGIPDNKHGQLAIARSGCGFRIGIDPPNH